MPKTEKTEKYQITVRLDPNLVKKVKVAGIEDDLELQQIVGLALEAWLKARKGARG